MNKIATRVKNKNSILSFSFTERPIDMYKCQGDLQIKSS